MTFSAVSWNKLRARIQICWVWPSLSPQTEPWSSTVEQLHSARGAQRAAADGGRQLPPLNAGLGGEFRLPTACEICSSLQTVFADCVTLSFLRRKQGNSALFAWASHPPSLAENTLCCSMDSSFLIHCSNYVLQPEYGTYVKADG